MNPVCNPQATDNKPMAQNPVNEFYQSFVDRGLMADYMSRRGSRVLQVIVGWEQSGVRSYLAGRPQRFSDEMDINNGTVKAIELMDETQIPIIPSQPPTDHIASEFDQGYLVLVDQCNNEVARLPLTVLNKNQNGGKLCFFDLPNLQWNECYVVFPAAAGINQNNGLLFAVHID